ncbi:MAG: iron-containing alcohol dehydrogenase [Planctomycetota bacterium]|nr:iron-containing alcohol dehydrogenase [Planctomycetota bacterium]
MKIPTPFAFDLLTPKRIVFGWGRRRELGDMIASLGTRCFIVLGSRTLLHHELFNSIQNSLEATGITTNTPELIGREPHVSDVDQAVQRARIWKADVVLGIGGGAALDLAKAVAALTPQTTPASVSDYLEGVGRELSLSKQPLPNLLMPTTAGTGSEATKNAVISSPQAQFKKSLRADSMLTDVALVDPELTVTTSPNVTLHSGMDALTQCVESYLSCRATVVTRTLALEGFHHAWTALPLVMQNPGLRTAREAMSYAALLSGISLANSGLGMAHGVAAALGIHAAIPHGLACAIMLPVALQVNLTSARDNLNQLDAARGDVNTSSAESLLEAIRALSRSMGLPERLRDIDVKRDQLAAIAASSGGNSMRGNPREITDAELRDILHRAW